MSPSEIKRFVQLENQYKTPVVWRRIYAYENGELISGMTYIVNGHVVETIWEK